MEHWASELPNGQRVLFGYHWNRHKQQLWKKRNGVGGFCYEEDSFAVQSHPLGTQAVETIFFSNVDLHGQKAHAKLLSDGPERLTAEERSDFIRFMMSLAARQPDVIRALRTEGAEHFRRGFDEDRAVVEAVAKVGVNVSPSVLVEQMMGMTMADRAMLTVQGATDSPQVGEQLFHADWQVRHLDRFDGHCVLSDRPLVRTGDFRDPRTIWVLPLTPKALFIATRSRELAQKLRAKSTAGLARLLNSDQALQSTRYVFSTVHTELGWLERRLKIRAESPVPSMKLIGIGG